MGRKTVSDCSNYETLGEEASGEKRTWKEPDPGCTGLTNLIPWKTGCVYYDLAFIEWTGATIDFVLKSSHVISSII